MRTPRWISVGLGALVALAGCSTPVAGALDEDQANRVVVALDRAGIGSEKEPDPSAEGRFRIVIDRDDAARAITTLREENLPLAPAPGLLESVGKGGILPSQAAEHAQFVAGLAGELERTFTGVDGVLSARVHFSLPMADPLAESRPKPTASVLVKYRGETPPVDPNAIQRLVSGAAAGLSPDDVAVVLLARPGAIARPEQVLARLGPIWATRGSISLLRVVLATSLLLHVALVGAVLFLWARVRRPVVAHADTTRRHEHP